MLDHRPPAGNEAIAGNDKEATADNVFAVAGRYVSRLREHEAPVIAEAGRALAERLLGGGTVWVFGTGHSRTVAMELAGRAGGLSAMKELVLEDLVASGWASKEDFVSGELERRPDAATALLQDVVIGVADAFVVISHSGCNGAPVEMALQASRRGLPVVAVTSLEHSRTVRSRHPSGLRLFEVAAISIDTGAPYADTAVSVGPGPGGPEGPGELGVCSVSSFAGILVAQALTAEIVGCYLQAGVVPPLLVSRNLPS
jgi:uncharacterized phosphosugar-binding protein